MKKILSTDKAPSAIGPYSQGTSAAGLVFISGQIPIDPATGEFVEGGIEEQTRQSIINLKQILASNGNTLDNVVKTTVLLNDMNDFAAMNAVYKEMFGEGDYPARAAFEVARLPKDALVEIEAIAVNN